MVRNLKAFKGPLLSTAQLEVQAFEFHETINLDCITTGIKYTNKSNFWLVLLTPSTFSSLRKFASMNTFQNNLKNFCISAVAKKKKNLTAIITFELRCFNCDLQTAMHDERAGKDTDNEPPPIPSLKQ